MANATERAIRKRRAAERIAAEHAAKDAEIARLRENNRTLAACVFSALSQDGSRRAAVDSVGYKETPRGYLSQSQDTRKPQYRADSIGTGQGTFPIKQGLFAGSVDF